MIDSRQKFLAVAAHIGYLFFGCGYVLLPLVLYLLYKNSDEFVAGHAKQALTAQGMFGLVCVVGTVLILIRIGVILLPFVILLCLLWLCSSLYACFRVLRGEKYHYPLLGRF
ncbi:DUF4870 domain-containing protein [Selenomonas ruminantium]|uniref:DUF4870 domain-containing protein n=1 Tax=Selenomonas ruminantium TaxID=971 RepID=UPI0005A55647|nr:DUF4870 domain-containing protein [Selenomonas ruminantium]